MIGAIIYLSCDDGSKPGSRSSDPEKIHDRAQTGSMRKYDDRVLALAGLVQAASLISSASSSGLVSQDTLESSINSIFIQNPGSTLDVFGGVTGVRKGLLMLRELLTNFDVAQHGRIMQYALAVMGLERRLVTSPAIMRQLGAEIANIDEQRMLRQGDSRVIDDVSVQQLGILYESLISEIQPQIRINGNRQHLQDRTNIERIRALLLAGLRACVLWRQVGGNKWQLAFNRRSMTRSVEALL